MLKELKNFFLKRIECHGREFGEKNYLPFFKVFLDNTYKTHPKRVRYKFRNSKDIYMEMIYEHYIFIYFNRFH